MVESVPNEVLAQGTIVLEGVEPIRQHIVSTLRQMTEVGGVHNFLILEADPAKNFFVQFATSCGGAVIHYESVSDRYLSAPLTQAQRDELQRLGWRRPTPQKWPNYFRLWRTLTDMDRQELADHALETLERVYAWRRDAPLRTKTHLDW